ncbi:MAG TPA: polysaccharide deacetylase family protein [Kofleriaceae bacterium]|nr:polysaccharide deacetylase family protein [Kofleriaceae bacterium]
MLALVLVLVFALGVAAIAIPYVCVKHLGWGVWKRARRTDGAIGLSFDDGPDPIATPRILDILARAGVRATFFVTGEAADAHPELVHRTVAAGHEVASHGYRHRHALFQRWPLAGFFDTRKAVHRLEAMVGSTRFYRGPFGAYSWASLAAAWRCRVQPVNWTVEAHDWHPAFTPASVVDKVLREARSGGVIVMHDAGRGAVRSVDALEPVLAGLAARGLHAVPLAELWP